MAVSHIEAIRCNKCGADAEYLWAPAPQFHEHLCGECARYRGTFDRGYADAAIDTLGCAVSLARTAGVTDDQLRGAFEAILSEDTTSTGSYAVGGGDGVLGSDDREDRPWQWSGAWARLLDERGGA